MMRVLKIGDQYLTSTGDLSPRQSDAMRIGAIDLATLKNLRPVKLRAYGAFAAGQDTDPRDVGASTNDSESPF